MKRNKISIKDISKALGLSNTTISFILNGKAEQMRISTQAVEKVLAYVKEVGYTPNYLARGLVTGKTNTIGFIVENIGNPFFSQIASLIEEQAYTSGYKIIYSSTNGQTEKAKELIHMFRDRGVDGYIICPTEGLEDEISQLHAEGRPVVFFDRYLPQVSCHYIGLANEKAMFDACAHLVQCGKSNIALVTTDSDQTQMLSRLSGYRKLIRMKGLKEFILHIPYQSRKEEMAAKFERFMLKYKELDGICFSTNYLAVEGLEVLRKIGVQIPSVGIIAFDDNEVLRLFQPSITAVAQPLDEMAKLIIEQLLVDLKLGKVPDTFVHLELDPHLILRESTQKIPSKYHPSISE